MTRVERRMYKYRRRSRLRWIIVTAALLIAGVALYTQGTPFSSAPIGEATPPPAASTEVQTREVTLSAEAWYAIQTGVYSTREAADERAAAFTGRGAPGTVIRDGDKWRVFIACYGSEADAAAVRTRLGDRQQVDTYLYAWEMPEVRLRLTGQTDQLDAVEAGFTLLTSAAAALRDAAILLDAGELTTQEAANRAAAIADQAELWTKTARARFGRRIPDLVQSMLAIADGMAVRTDAIRKAADSATTLSAELKGQAMGLYDEAVQWRTALSAQ